MSLEVLEATDDWLQFDLDGWIWIQSVQVVNRGSFDLVVSVEGGENIRGAPGGEILGHLEQGTLLETVERVSGWARVRRRAWVWRRSVALFGADPSGGSEERSSFTVSSSGVDGGEWALGGSSDAPILSTTIFMSRDDIALTTFAGIFKTDMLDHTQRHRNDIELLTGLGTDTV